MKVMKRGSYSWQLMRRIEAYLEANGILITGDNLRLQLNGATYCIGRDATEFPRSVNDDFIVDE